MDIQKSLYLWLKEATRINASDLHLRVGSLPILRINGTLSPLESANVGEKIKEIQPSETRDLAYAIMDKDQIRTFERQHEIDLAHSVTSLGRFRVNIYKQRGTIGMVFRVIPTQVLRIRDLNLPRVLENLALINRGLILCTGTTGSGKTTTLASMVDHINRNKMVNIITIEDPIEYLHDDKKSIIIQREVGTDTRSFSKAMRSVLRQDPDVILVGEMRDKLTVETALMAAETGHLVMSTLHTVDAVETINRIISYFEPHHHHQVRIQLASVLKGVISQRLIPRADLKGRVPAVEIMIATPIIRECIIHKDRTRYIIDAMRQGVSQYGMQTFDQSLAFLVQQNLITYQEALERSTNPDDFALKFKGIQSTADMSMEQLENTLYQNYDYMENPELSDVFRGEAVSGIDGFQNNEHEKVPESGKPRHRGNR